MCRPAIPEMTNYPDEYFFRLNLTGTCCMKVNKTGADGTLGLALGERIKVVIRTRALTVTVTLLRMDSCGQIVKSMMGSK